MGEGDFDNEVVYHRLHIMKKFIFEEKFISYADVEIYAENEEDARRQFQNGNYQYMMYLTSQMDMNLLVLGRSQNDL